MAQGYQALTEKEKQTLRLMLRGHDAKSLARHLDLSVHTVNERLRDARRKLEVSSSRAAARLLLEEEGRTPKLLGDEGIGEAMPVAGMEGMASLDALAKTKNRFAWGIAGVIVMSAVFAILALAAQAPDSADPSDPANRVVAKPQASIVLAETEAPVRCKVVGDGQGLPKTQIRRGDDSANAADALSRSKAPVRLRCDSLPR